MSYPEPRHLGEAGDATASDGTLATDDAGALTWRPPQPACRLSRSSAKLPAPCKA
jgi:hypothetical protein